ncbi:MAG: hypothetical protein KY453_02530 [Gemmatimonadetes bacterium]|nr:hypothetical protein [Gemmatimonadota bacterium]
MDAPSFFRRYLLPGFVFQSVVIAGGYGTGRELVEFFLTQGPLGGLLAIAVSTLVWSAVCMASFEFARRFRAYDYRVFFRRLLGPAWILFEICYIAMLLLVLAVVAAASGEILRETFGLPYALGVVGIMVAIGALAFGGNAAIERALAGWSFVLYGVYITLFAWSFARFGPAIGEALVGRDAGGAWIAGGVRYAAYNLATIPAVLFVIRHHRRAREALVSGALAGPIAIVPAVLFYLAMVGQYPAVLASPVPANDLLVALDARWFQVLFQVVLFGTLVETGTGMIHAVNERLAGRMAERDRPLPAWIRPAVAVGFLVLGTLLSRFGLIALIARGYGTLTWAFLLVFVIPVLTLGVWKMVRAPKTAAVG